MSTAGVHETKTNLSGLLRRVSAGEEIVITRNGEPLAKLVPVRREGRRELGIDDGRFEVPDDFDAPLPEALLDAFER
ncbi:MAG: type II toxin-antitoxin system Phd/YefM family antitoxin [Streptosporangiaceae bacterium]